MTGRGDLTNAEWAVLEPLLPSVRRRGRQWSDHRRVINGVFFRVRTGVPWRDLPERFGPWETVYKRHRRWSEDGTWERLWRRVQALRDAAGEIDWDVAVDSTTARAHQHAAGAPRSSPPDQKGARKGTNQDERMLSGLADRLAEVVRAANASEGHGAGSPPRSTSPRTGGAVPSRSS